MQELSDVHTNASGWRGVGQAGGHMRARPRKHQDAKHHHSSQAAQERAEHPENNQRGEKEDWK